MDLLISAVLFLGALIFCLVRGAEMFWPLLIGFASLAVCARRRGQSCRALWAMVRGQMKDVMIVNRILCFVGLLTGLWRSSGTIAFFIHYGIRIIPPALFVLLAFVLSALLSFAIGTSFGVTSTAGVMLIALARAGGVPVPVAAGAILSGVYFGDRGAPTSSCAELVAVLTDTSHYENVHRMMRTAALPVFLSLTVYAALSLANPIQSTDEALLTAISDTFRISWLLVIPAVIMLILPLLKVPIRLSMAVSAAAAFVLTVWQQGQSLLSALGAAVLGFHPDGALADVLSGGGLLSMLSTMILLIFAGGCAGIIEGLGLLENAQAFLVRLSGRIGRFPALCLTALAASAVLCNQTIAAMACHQLLEPVYARAGAEKEELAIDLSNSVVTLAGLVPWCIACSVPLSMLGASYSALPYAVLLYLIPLCYLFMKRHYYPEKARRTSEVSP